MKQQERIGAVTLGHLTNKKFLTGIIPDQWEEKVYDHDTYWSVKCRRVNLVKMTYSEEERQYSNICKQIIAEFGDLLMEIYGIEGVDTGSHFLMYLKKKQ